MVCHHMNNIHICHHFGMKISDGDRYESFIPSLHTVTFVTVWRLGMKIFHTCHQKMLSDGDGLIGITIESFGEARCSKIHPCCYLLVKRIFWFQHYLILEVCLGKFWKITGSQQSDKSAILRPNVVSSFAKGEHYILHSYETGLKRGRAIYGVKE